MCTPECLCCGIANLAIGQLFESAKRRFVYLRNYKDNKQKLKDKLDELETKKGQIQQAVMNANISGNLIKDEVENWLVEVREKEAEFLSDETAEENIQCFVFSCPNFIRRYKLSRQAEEKINEVQNVVNRGQFQSVSHPKPPPPELQFPPSTANYMSFGSRAPVFQKIMEALNDPEDKIIGVYGPGGIGKTTMVQAVAKHVREHSTFDEVVMAVVSKDANVIKTQQQIADGLDPKLYLATGSSAEERARQLWNRLENGRKNLIILDDIWEELDLRTIGIPITDGNNGCKVVLTSRDRGVCSRMEVRTKILVRVLSEDEAWDLFKRQVGEYDVVLDCVARELCRECGGLPVAINVVGASMKDTTKAVWENSLEKLKGSILEKKVYTSLKLSYDNLASKDEQSIFLLCCFFPEDAQIPIEDLMRHCVARRLLAQNPDTLHKARTAVHAAVHTLKIHCLLLDGCTESFVKVHDVIRDVGIAIMKDELNMTFLVNDAVREWPGKDKCQGCSAISLHMEDFLTEVPDDLECPQLHTLLLYFYELHPFTIPDRFFQGMKKLTVLELIRMFNGELPLSFTNLVNLRTLSLHECHLKDIARLKDLKSNLEILSLRHCFFEASLLLEIGELTSLRLLDLRDCVGGILIPQGVISKLTSLEEFYIWDCYQIDIGEACEIDSEIDSEIDIGEECKVRLGELKELKRFTTLEIHIQNDVLWPDDVCFDNLSHFKISVGPTVAYRLGIEYASEIQVNLIHLEEICIKAPRLESLDILFDRVEILTLVEVEDVKELFNDRSGWKRFSKLSELEIENCEDIEHLVGKRKKNLLIPSDGLNLSTSPSTGPFSKLKRLAIFNSSFKYLFPTSVGLQQLKDLHIENCEMMEEVIVESTEGEKEPTTNPIKLSQLESIHLSDLPKLISFYPKMEETTTQSLFNEKVAFPALKELYVEELPNITKIWDEQLNEAESFSHLKKISVQCEKFVNVIPSCMIGQFQDVTGTECESDSANMMVYSKQAS